MHYVTLETIEEHLKKTEALKDCRIWINTQFNSLFVSIPEHIDRVAILLKVAKVEIERFHGVVVEHIVPPSKAVGRTWVFSIKIIYPNTTLTPREPVTTQTSRELIFAQQINQTTKELTNRGYVVSLDPQYPDRIELIHVNSISSIVIKDIANRQSLEVYKVTNTESHLTGYRNWQYYFTNRWRTTPMTKPKTKEELVEYLVNNYYKASISKAGYIQIKTDAPNPALFGQHITELINALPGFEVMISNVDRDSVVLHVLTPESISKKETTTMVDNVLNLTTPNDLSELVRQLQKERFACSRIGQSNVLRFTIDTDDKPVVFLAEIVNLINSFPKFWVSYIDYQGSLDICLCVEVQNV